MPVLLGEWGFSPSHFQHSTTRLPGSRIRRRGRLGPRQGRHVMDKYVIWTRYVRPTGKIVRHAYGPYDTRSKAQTALRKMRREHEMMHGPMLAGQVEAVVTVLIDTESLNQ